MPVTRDRGTTGTLVRGLGPFAAASLVAGNIIASGVYVIPGTLADVAGPVSLVAWAINAAAFLCLAAVFADLGGAYPVSGGPQSFVRLAFGDFAGLQTSYLYWLSCVTCNAALVTGFMGYLAVFVPGVANPVASFLAAQALLWALTLVNILGVRAGGAVQSVTTVLKILPLLVLIVPLLLRASVSNMIPFAPHGYGAVFPAISLVAWLFLGSESVTVPGEEVAGAGPAIRRSAYLGFGVAAVLYLLMAVALAAGIPSGDLAGSPSPLAVAASRVIGPAGEALVTLGALISIFGALNGWLLVTGRLPFAAARDGFAPAPLARIHPRYATPAVSLAISALIGSVLIGLYFNRTLLQAYNFIALLSTATALIAIGAGCAAHLVLLRRHPDRFSQAQRRRGPFVAVMGIVIALLMTAGTGWVIALYAVLSMSVPAVYYLLRAPVERV